MQKLFDYMYEQHDATLLVSDMAEVAEIVSKEQGTFEILKELQRAETIHPDYPTDMFKQLAIMQEEAGEVTKAVLDCQSGKDTVEHVVTELVQTAAMCMRMIKNLIDTAETQALNIPVVTNRTFSVNEVKILLEKQKQACANEFIHAEMTIDEAKRRVLNAPTVNF